MTSERPHPTHRLAWALGALGAGAVFVVALVVIVVVDDATRDPGAMGGHVPMYVWALGVTAPTFVFGACLGMALVPRSVVERGRAREFGVAAGLAVLGALLSMPTVLWCVTGPPGALALAAAFALFLRTRRPRGVSSAAVAQPARDRIEDDAR